MGKIPAAMILTAALFLPLSCKQIFTYSLGESVARDEIPISKNTDLSDLLDMAQKYNLPKEITNTIATKDAAEILALSTEDQTAVLQLAMSAVGGDDFSSVIKNSSLPTADMVEAFLESFDSSVDLTAVETILNNYHTTPNDIGETTIILAAAILLADAVNATDAATVMDILSGGSPVSTIADPLIQNQLTTVMNIATDLSSSTLNPAGFDILALLTGGS